MKNSILDELVKANRLPVLFIGSGISKRYLYGYPSWEELLEKSFEKYETDSFQYQKHMDECRRKKMSDFETNVYMGTLIEEQFNRAFYDRKIKLGIGNSKNPSWVKRGISPIRVRETRKVVKTIVDQSLTMQDAESIIVGIDDLESIDLSAKPLAIAIGYKDNILNKYGYGRFDDGQIYEDIIYDNKKFDSAAMCDERLRGIQINRLLPVYKYVKGREIPKESKLYKYIQAHNTMDEIISNNVVKSIKNTPVIETYKELVEYMDTTANCRKSAMAVLKNMNLFSIEELRNACKYLFEKYPNEYATETNTKRCIMCLDFRENCK